MAVQSCTRYERGARADDNFHQREEIPESWRSGGNLDDIDQKSTASDGQDADAGGEGATNDRQGGGAGSAPPPEAQISASAGGKKTDGGRDTRRGSIPYVPLREDGMYAWVYALKNDEIAAMIGQGLSRNFALAQSWHRLEGLRHIARIEASGLYPQLSLHIGTQRARSAGAPPVSNVNASLNLQWEIDWLGKMADQRRAAVLRYQSAWQTHRHNQLRLATDIARAWYQLDASQRLLKSQTRSLENLRENLEIVERAWRDGISGSLDVLLARNDLALQSAVVRNQETTVRAHSRALQLLLGVYPDGLLRCAQPVAGVDHVQDLSIPEGIPADLLRRRSDLNSAWYEVLAADLDLAAASKDRFPRLTLTAAYGGASSSLSGLVGQGFNVWSLGVSLVQHLFDGGRRRAVRRQRRSELERIEQAWLQKIYGAFAEVEALLSEYDSLRARLKFSEVALDNSEQAYNLALEQYADGTAFYTAVLQAQRRVFDARIRWINNRAQLRRNRVDLFLALGGGFGGDNASASAASATER